MKLSSFWSYLINVSWLSKHDATDFINRPVGPRVYERLNGLIVATVTHVSGPLFILLTFFVLLVVPYWVAQIKSQITTGVIPSASIAVIIYHVCHNNDEKIRSRHVENCLDDSECGR